MKKLLFLALPMCLFCQFSVQAESPVLPICNNEIVSTSFTVDFSTTEDLSGLELLSAQQLRFKDSVGNPVTINAMVTQAVYGNTLDVTFSCSASLTGLTIENGQQLEFVDISSAPETVDFIVHDLVIH